MFQVSSRKKTTQSQKRSLSDKIEGGVGMFGKVSTITESLGSIMFSVILFIVAWYLLSSKRTGQVMGKVMSMTDCYMKSSESSNKKISSYEICNYEISYKVGDTTYTMYTQDNKNKYPLNSTIKVFYDPANPWDANLSEDTKKLIGWGVLFFGLMIMIVSIVRAYFVTVSEDYAKFEGVAGIARGTADYAGMGPQRYNNTVDTIF
jgi:hypothetical protein